jgi:single-strand DNA-binding protein
MASLGKMILIGNVGADPILNHTREGKAVTNISVAYNRRWKGKDTAPVWFKVTVWGDRAETVVKYLRKGMTVHCMGDFDIDTYTDRNGREQQAFVIANAAVEFLSPMPRDGESAPAGAGAATAAPAAAPAPQQSDYEDLPF